MEFLENEGNKVNKDLASGMMNEDEYQMWLEDTLRLFNMQIDDYVYKWINYKILGTLEIPIKYFLNRNLVIPNLVNNNYFYSNSSNN